jgi:hypothetical protein
VHDEEALQHFMYFIANAMKGHSEQPATLTSVRKYWNFFTGGWRREHEPIRSDLVESITNERSKYGISKYLAD